MNLPRIRRVAPVTASVVAMLVFGLAACDDDGNDATDSTGTSTPDTTNTTDDSDDTTDDTDDTAGTDDTTEDTDDTVGTDDTGSTPGSGTDDSGAPATEEDYVAAAAVAIGFQDTEMSECLAQALIDGIGFARIEASGVSPEEFTSAPSLVELDLGIAEDDAADVQVAMTECGDIVESFLSSSEANAEEADCARGVLTNELMAESLVTQIAELPRSAELQAAVDTLEACDAG